MDELYVRLNHLRSQRVPTAQIVKDDQALLAELNALCVHRDILRKSPGIERNWKYFVWTYEGISEAPIHETCNWTEAVAYTEQWCKGKNVKECRLQQLTKFKGDGNDAIPWAVWHENFISECTSVGADEEDPT